MKINELRQAFNEKDWQEFSQIFESLLQQNLSNDESFEIYNLVSKIDNLTSKNFFNQFFKLNYSLWSFCQKLGKVADADRFAEYYLENLIERKKIITLNNFLNELEQSGSLKKKIKKIKMLPSALLGNKESYKNLIGQYEISDWHFEYWGEDSEAFKDYILARPELRKDDLKLIYKYILKFNFDEELIIKLLEYKDLKKDEIENIERFLISRKIKIPQKSLQITEKNTSHSRIDYDQIAFDLISGKIELDVKIEERIIKSLNYLSEEDLKLKGHDMLVAFRLLEMNRVTLAFCEKLLLNLNDIKLRASVMFIKVQTLIELDESYKALDIIDDIILKMPLFGQELSAFWYLKYLAYKQLGKKENADQVLIQIKKMDFQFKTANLGTNKI